MFSDTTGWCRIVTDEGRITRTTSYYYELNIVEPFLITDIYIEASDEDERTRWKEDNLEIRLQHEGENCEGFTQLDPRAADWGLSR